jgi:t-SNARE complex subunit (syntaxin)
MGKNSDYVTRDDVEEIVERILARNNKILLEDISGVINDLGFRMQEYIHEKTAPITQIQKDVKELKSDTAYLKSTADDHTKRLFRLEAVDDRILDTLKLGQKRLGQYT